MICVLQLGKQEYKKDKRDLKFRDYVTGTLPPVPVTFGHQNIHTC